jgi:hypothetical protein
MSSSSSSGDRLRRDADARRDALAARAADLERDGEPAFHRLARHGLQPADLVDIGDDAEAGPCSDAGEKHRAFGGQLRDLAGMLG